MSAVEKPQKLSPISVDASVTPTARRECLVPHRVQHVRQHLSLIQRGRHVQVSDWLMTTTGWNKRNFGPSGVGLADINHYLNHDTSVSFNKNRVGGSRLVQLGPAATTSSCSDDSSASTTRSAAA